MIMPREATPVCVALRAGIRGRGRLPARQGKASTDGERRSARAPPRARPAHPLPRLGRAAAPRAAAAAARRARRGAKQLLHALVRRDLDLHNAAAGAQALHQAVVAHGPRLGDPGWCSWGFGIVQLVIWDSRGTKKGRGSGSVVAHEWAGDQAVWLRVRRARLGRQGRAWRRGGTRR